MNRKKQNVIEAEAALQSSVVGLAPSAPSPPILKQKTDEEITRWSGVSIVRIRPVIICQIVMGKKGKGIEDERHKIGTVTCATMCTFMKWVFIFGDTLDFC